MFVYRIVHTKFSGSLFAPGLAGRWNSDGKKVIYAAESIPLAFLENMVRRQGVGFSNLYSIMIIEIPDSLSILEVDPTKLSAGWRNPHDYSICQPLGDDWYDKGIEAVLKVPSAVLVSNYNYVINSTHADFSRITLQATTPLVPDERIDDILRNYTATA